MAQYLSEGTSSSSSGDEAIAPVCQDGGPLPDGGPGYMAEDSTEGASSEDVSSSGDSPGQTTEPGNMASRAYQLEMLEESLKHNIIVAMDTGSGKTRIAVLRIAAELERSPPSKICWFLAPSVALCYQQYDVLRTQIPSASVKVVTGADGVECWSGETWAKALHSVRVVVSTFQILVEALQHAFVTMQRLALIVIDEAHNCAKDHPGRRIMIEWYRQDKEAGKSVPAILGLTASPIMGSKLDAMSVLEITLDAVCRTPTRHREELLSQVKRPEMYTCVYTAHNIAAGDWTPAMKRLSTALDNLDISEDPYIKSLRAANTDRSRRRLEKALEKNDTWIQKQMKAFTQRSQAIFSELGPWAADYFIAEAVHRFTSTAGKPSPFRGNWEDDEKRYLMGILREVMPLENGMPVPTSLPASGSVDLSDKAQKLIEILATYEGKPFGIVFVRERAMTRVLAHLLSVHPAIQDKYKAASVVGASSFRGRTQDFFDLSSEKDSQSLKLFHKGGDNSVNLLVATTVIEEGIDIPSCNIIICYDEPANLKSFIQRRGRARDHNSRIYLLLESSAQNAITKWEDLEKKMKAQYEDETRKNEEIRAREESDFAEPPFPPLIAEVTGARLTMDEAKPHLEHFCATLSSHRYVDYRPDYIIHEDSVTKLLSATVQLPVSLPAELRAFNSATAWKSERNASKDAAFQAYKALYAAGLINDNLLPHRETVDRHIEARPSMKDVKAQLNPWRRIALAWNDVHDPASIHRRPLALKDEHGHLLCEVDLLLPVQVTLPERLEVYWSHNSTTPWTVEMESDVTMSQGPDILSDGRAHTSTLLALPYSHRWAMADRHQLLRFASNSRELDTQLLGYHEISPDTEADEVESLRHCIVRDAAGQPWIYQGWSAGRPSLDQVKLRQGGRPYYGFEEFPEDMPHLYVSKWPKRAGAVRPMAQVELPSSDKMPIIPVAGAKFDAVPLVYAQLGMLIPFLTHALEIHLLAAELLTSTPLRQLGISDLSLITTALSAPNAGRYTDYERIEFLGDSILKFCTTVNVSAQNLKWPEGLLSLLKDKLVSNSRLFRAAVAIGLDQFIATDRFSLKDWRDMYNTDLLVAAPEEPPIRNMSTKILADVVEALIAAAFLDGGMASAQRCISIFLPEAPWWDVGRAQDALFTAAAENAPLPPPFEPLERLVGYTFTRKALLVEAMTHGSYDMGSNNVASAPACLERLEFIGDAVLDFVVVSRLFATNIPQLRHFDMHLFRTALVNGDFLAFITMEWAVDAESYEVETDPSLSYKERRHAKPTIHSTTTRLPFWSFMRHANPVLAAEQSATSTRHAATREDIASAIATGARYPWAQLARLRAAKCYSDAFEALIGAVWVDSGGSLEAVEGVLERCGIMGYMRRMVRGEVHVWHPKEELGKLAGQKRVRYDVTVVEGEELADKEFVCKVTVGDKVVVEVGGGVTREESKTRAAEKAVRLWGLETEAK